MHHPRDIYDWLEGSFCAPYDLDVFEKVTKALALYKKLETEGVSSSVDVLDLLRRQHALIEEAKEILKLGITVDDLRRYHSLMVHEAKLREEFVGRYTAEIGSWLDAYE